MIIEFPIYHPLFKQQGNNEKIIDYKQTKKEAKQITSLLLQNINTNNYLWCFTTLFFAPHFAAMI